MILGYYSEVYGKVKGLMAAAMVKLNFFPEINVFREG